MFVHASGLLGVRGARAPSHRHKSKCSLRRRLYREYRDGADGSGGADCGEVRGVAFISSCKDFRVAFILERFHECRSSQREARPVVADRRSVHRSPETTVCRAAAYLAHVPGRKQERAGASLPHAGRGLRRRWKRAPQLSGVNCVVSASQLAGRQPTPSDRPVDSGLGDTYGPRRTAWGVHSLPVS
jgi:hypothetical protein